MDSIYEYRDYRNYLRDYYESRKKRSSGFSYRVFAKHAGLSSPMHLRMVITGERNLSDSTASKFVKGLRLKEDEARYFRELVQFAQESDPDIRAQTWKRIERTRKRKLGLDAVDKSSQSTLFSVWFAPLLFELARHKDWDGTARGAKKLLRLPVPISEVDQVLSRFFDLEILVKTEEGRVEQGVSFTRTDDEVENLLVRDYHRKMMELSVRHFEDPLEDREMGFVTVCSTRENFQKLKKEIKQFILDKNEELTLEGKDAKGDALIQMNIEAFLV